MDVPTSQPPPYTQNKWKQIRLSRVIFFIVSKTFLSQLFCLLLGRPVYKRREIYHREEQNFQNFLGEHEIGVNNPGTMK